MTTSYTITVVGVGPCKENRDYDADALAKIFVRVLKKKLHASQLKLMLQSKLNVKQQSHRFAKKSVHLLLTLHPRSLGKL